MKKRRGQVLFHNTTLLHLHEWLSHYMIFVSHLKLNFINSYFFYTQITTVTKNRIKKDTCPSVNLVSRWIYIELPSAHWEPKPSQTLLCVIQIEEVCIFIEVGQNSSVSEIAMGRSLKGRMVESTNLNHAKQRLIGSKKASEKMIGPE